MFVAAEPHRARDDTRPLDAFTLATPGLVSSIFAHSRQDADERQNQPFVSSSLRALFLAENLQPSSFHALPHSFARRKNVTPTFQVTSPLLPRSLAQERKSTPLLSCACARFCRNGGCLCPEVLLEILHLRRLPLQSLIVHWPSDAVVAPHTMRVPRRPAGGPE